MKFLAQIEVMPRPELLDPQGKATLSGLQQMGFTEFESLRIGKKIQLKLEVESETEARTRVEEACKKLLVNPIMETYSFQLEKA